MAVTPPEPAPASTSQPEPVGRSAVRRRAVETNAALLRNHQWSRSAAISSSALASSKTSPVCWEPVEPSAAGEGRRVGVEVATARAADALRQMRRVAITIATPSRPTRTFDRSS
jgi:hypothetical protein